MWTQLAVLISEVSGISEKEEKIPHLTALLEQCRKDGIFVYGEDKAKQLLHTCPASTLCITDRQKVIMEMAERSIACLGYEKTQSVPLTGISYVVQDFDGISMQFLNMVYCRFHGIPLAAARTKRLLIREMCPADTGDLYHLYQEQEVRENVKESAMTMEELEEFVRAYSQNRYAMYEYGMWILEDLGSGEFIGEAGLEDFEMEGMCYVNLGYAIKSGKRNQGYAREACLAILEYARQRPGLADISCLVQPGNIASEKTAQSLGFVKTKLKTICKFNKFDYNIWMLGINHEAQ